MAHRDWEILRWLQEFEEPQVLHWNGQLSLTCHRLGAIKHPRFLRRQGHQRALGRRKACGGKHAVADVFDFVLAPIIVTVLRGQHHVVPNRPQLLSVHPQEHLGLGYARFHIEMVTVQGDTPRAIGGTRKQRPRKLAGEFLLGLYPALGLTQDVERDRRGELVCEEPRMRRRIIGFDKGLLEPFELPWRGGSRALVVAQAALDIDVRFHPMQVAFAVRTFHGLVIDA